MKTGNTVKKETLTIEGILEKEVLIYIGDGIYVEAEPIPQKLSGNQGQDSDTNNNICWGNQKNSTGSED